MKSLIAHTMFIGLALATVGCSATKDEMTKQMDEVKREITQLRASNAVLKDRLDMLESAPKAERVASADADTDESGDRPSLEVVHLSPEEEPQEPATVIAPPVDDSPPIVIVGDDQGVAEVDEEAASKPKAKTAKAGYPKYPRKRGH